MYHIIITLDYEIFGNGKGDVINHVINPTNRLLSICNKNDVKITIMVEMLEYIFFKDHEDWFTKEWGYSPKEKIKKQITDAYHNGHDIQLHIHPQFLSLSINDGQLTVLDPTKSVYNMSEKEIKFMLNHSKRELCNIINDKGYSCSALRLSNMPWIEPPKPIRRVIRDCGFKIHSLSSTFENVNKPSYWELCNSLYEIPIHSKPINYYEYFNFKRLYLLLKTWLYSPPRKRLLSESHVNKSGLVQKWDYSKLTCAEMIELFSYAKNKYKGDLDVPLVMIGHSKDFYFSNEFVLFLNKLKQDNSDSYIKFDTFKGFSELLK